MEIILSLLIDKAYCRSFFMNNEAIVFVENLRKSLNSPECFNNAVNKRTIRRLFIFSVEFKTRL
jgi:hypothetical protein